MPRIVAVMVEARGGLDDGLVARALALLPEAAPAILPGLPRGPAGVVARAALFLALGRGATASVDEVQAAIGAVARSEGTWAEPQGDMLRSYGLPNTREALAELATASVDDVARLREVATALVEARPWARPGPSLWHTLLPVAASWFPSVSPASRLGDAERVRRGLGFGARMRYRLLALALSVSTSGACADDPGSTFDTSSPDSATMDTTSGEVSEDAGETASVEVDAGEGDAAPAEVVPPGCALTAYTTATSTVSATGCALLERDTSACRAEREAAGLSGFWLAFSCRVDLSKATVDGVEVVRSESDGQPDYPSFYFAAADACYEDWAEGAPNPNRLRAIARTIDFPVTPVATAAAMAGGVVGLAVNGVSIFGDFAAPGDDIFTEAATFDRCGAHPTQDGSYHYHGEPYALSQDDARFIGVMRDGYPVYGRRDADGTLPTLDEHGGHTSVTADSPGTPAYHYHLNEQVSATAGTAGQRQWFLTRGTYRGTPAACGECR